MQVGSDFRPYRPFRRFSEEERGTAILELSLVASFLVMLMSAAFQFGYMFYVYSDMQNITRSVARDLAQGKITEQNTRSVQMVTDSKSGETLVSQSPFNPNSDYVDCTTALGYSNATAEHRACQEVPASLRSHVSVAASDENNAGPGVSGSLNVVSLNLDLDAILFMDPFGFIGGGRSIERYSVIVTQ
jgi:Flp pilus assembly protein TadG